MIAVLSRFSLRQRMMGMLAVTLVGLGAVAYAVHDGGTTARAISERLNGYALVALEAQGLATEAHQIRREEQVLLDTGDGQARERLLKGVADGRRTLDGIVQRAEAMGATELADLAREATGRLEAYGRRVGEATGHVEALVASRAKQEQAGAALARTFQEIERAITERNRRDAEQGLDPRGATALGIVAQQAMEWRLAFEQFQVGRMPNSLYQQRLTTAREQTGRLRAVPQEERDRISAAIQASVSAARELDLARVDFDDTRMNLRQSFDFAQSGLRALVDGAEEARRTVTAAGSAALDASIRATLMVLGGVLAIVSIISFLISIGIGRILGRIGGVTEALARGDTSVEVPFAERRDEIGQVARALGVFRENTLALSAAEAERVDLARRAEMSRREIETRLVESVGFIVERARAGDFSARAEEAADLGRLVELVRGLNALTAACEDFLDEADRALASLAEGDLSSRMREDFEGRLAVVAVNFNRAAGSLGETMAAVKDAAGATHAAADAISASTRDLSQRGESQAAALEETSAAVEEIAKTVSETAKTVDRAASEARRTAETARKGAEIAGQAVAAIDQVDQQAKKIGEIVGVIDGIAFQTNLLALNASVEAARAGEAGRGFAVVANEVRRLAQQSAEAARDVRQLIGETTTHVTGGVKLVRGVGDSLQAISGEVAGVARTFAEISDAAKEQSTGVDEIARALQQMDTLTQASAAAAEETASAAARLVDTAADLADQSSRFVTEAPRALDVSRRAA